MVWWAGCLLGLSAWAPLGLFILLAMFGGPFLRSTVEPWGLVMLGCFWVAAIPGSIGALILRRRHGDWHVPGRWYGLSILLSPVFVAGIFMWILFVSISGRSDLWGDSDASDYIFGMVLSLGVLASSVVVWFEVWRGSRF